MAENKSVPVTILKRLGRLDPTFNLPVTFQTRQGIDIQLNLTAKAMRKSEWAAVKDESQRAIIEAAIKPLEAKAEPASAADKPKAASRKRAAVAPAPVESVDNVASILASAFKELEEKGFVTNVNRNMQRDAALVAKFVTGWELEDAFSEAALVALEDDYAGALAAIATAYDRAIFQGRLGNF